MCRWSFNSTQLPFPKVYSRPFEFSNGCSKASIFVDVAPNGRLSLQVYAANGYDRSQKCGSDLTNVQNFWKLKETHTYTFTISKTHMRACVRTFMLTF